VLVFVVCVFGDVVCFPQLLVKKYLIKVRLVGWRKVTLSREQRHKTHADTESDVLCRGRYFCAELKVCADGAYHRARKREDVLCIFVCVFSGECVSQPPHVIEHIKLKMLLLLLCRMTTQNEDAISQTLVASY